MKPLQKPRHLLSFQVIDFECFNLVSGIHYALNWVRFLLGVLPKLYYCHPEAYRDIWRHK